VADGVTSNGLTEVAPGVGDWDERCVLTAAGLAADALSTIADVPITMSMSAPPAESMARRGGHLMVDEH